MPSTQSLRLTYDRVNLTGRIASASARAAVKQSLKDLSRPHAGKLDSFCRTTRLGAAAGTAATAVVGGGALPAARVMPATCHPIFAIFGTGVPYTDLAGLGPGWARPLQVYAQYGVTGFVEKGIVALADRAQKAEHQTLCKIILGVAIGVRLTLQAPRAASATLASTGLVVGALLGAAVAAGYWLYQQTVRGRTVWLDDILENRYSTFRAAAQSMNLAFEKADAVAKLNKQSGSWPTATQLASLYKLSEQERITRVSTIIDKYKGRGESLEAAADRMEATAGELRGGTDQAQALSADAKRELYLRITMRVYPGCDTRAAVKTAWKRASLVLHPDKVDFWPVEDARKRFLKVVFGILTHLKDVACGQGSNLNGFDPLFP